MLDRIYPFADPERLLSLVEMLKTENVPYVLCIMPIYANADYPAMERFCEVLRYAQSRGAGIVMHVPQVTLVNVTVEELQENIAMRIPPIRAMASTRWRLKRRMCG